MKKVTLNLKAGRPIPINRGRFVRVFDALHPIVVKTQTLGQFSNQESELIANTGAEFQLFESAEVVSEYDQKVVIAYSELMIFDNRLGVESATIMQTVSAQVEREIKSHQITAVRTKILTANPKRKKALIATRGVVTFYDAEVGGAGFKLDGDFDEQSNSELWASATSAATIDVMEFNYV